MTPHTAAVLLVPAAVLLAVTVAGALGRRPVMTALALALLAVLALFASAWYLWVQALAIPTN